MALAIQKDSGIEDLLFTSSLEKTLTSQFALKFISLDKFSFAVLARPEDKEEILAVLQEAAEEASKTSRKMQRFFRENGWVRRCRTVSSNMPETALWTSFCRS